MGYIDIDEFKSVLGVANLYPDEQLQQVMDTAEALVDGILLYNRSWSSTVSVNNLVAKAYLNAPHSFNVGDSISIVGLGVFSGTHTIIETARYWVTFTTTAADADYVYKPAGEIILVSQIGMYDAYPAVREAAQNIAMDIWAARSAPSGMIQSVDFQPTPYKLGRALLNRVHGLLAPYMDTGSFVG